MMIIIISIKTILLGYFFSISYAFFMCEHEEEKKVKMHCMNGNLIFSLLNKTKVNSSCSYFNNTEQLKKYSNSCKRLNISFPLYEIF